MSSHPVACALAVLVAAAPAAGAATITGVDLRSSAERIEVVVSASEPLTFQTFARSQPSALVVDLLDAAPAAGLSLSALQAGLVKQVSLERHAVRGSTLSRLSLALKQTADYDVSASGNEITISIAPEQGVSKQGAAAKQPAKLGLRASALTGTFAVTPKPLVALNTGRGNLKQGQLIGDGSIGRATSDVDLAQAAEGPRQMTYIGFKNTATESRVYARLNAEAKFTARREGDNLVVLEIQNATIPLRNNRNHLDTTFFASPVKMVTPSEVEDATPTIRITIEMKEAAPFTTRLEGRDVVIVFKK